MKNKYYMNEFQYFNGENYVTFNIVDLDKMENKIVVAVTNNGKISMLEYDLLKDSEGRFYFEYGLDFAKINIDDFEDLD